MRNSLLILILLTASTAHADSVHVNGFSCSNDNRNPWKMTGYAENAQRFTDGYDRHFSRADFSDELRAGISISYEWGSTTTPLDCNQLYELELDRLRLKIAELEALSNVHPEWTRID